MRTSLLSPLLIGSLAASLAACTAGKSPTGSGGTTGSGTSSSSSGGTYVDAGAPPGTTSYTLSVGLQPDGGLGCSANGVCPLSVQAGTQIVYCTYMHLGNPEPIEVIGFTSTQSLGGHHVILVANNKDQPDAQPVVCGQEESINPMNGSMIYITQVHQDSQLYPPQVGMWLPANASVMMQTHFIDATPNDLMVGSEVTVLAGAPGSVTIPGAPLLVYNNDVSVPEGPSTATASCIFEAGPNGPNGESGANMNMFMLAGHMHSHGTDFTLNFTDLDGGDYQIYDTTIWDSPTEKLFTPPLLVQPGAAFTWTCDYFNEDGGTIVSPNEMCAVLGNYYPAYGGSMSLFYTQGICIPVYGGGPSDGGAGPPVQLDAGVDGGE
jgi:hypothetical protein